MTGLSGARLLPDERRFLRDASPAGLILFARNCVDRDQIRRIVGDALDAIGDEDTLVLVDQEGGRVQRLAPPEWRALPHARQIGRLFEKSPETGLASARLIARLIAHDLREVGITVDCAPVLDLPVAGAHEIIGNRAYGDSADIVVPLARAFAGGLMEGGVVPIGKHVPGHGRARADSHVALPIVEADREELLSSDVAPFRALADLPAMMTAHVVFQAFDSGAAASISQTVHREIIRGAIGFDGLLVSDDLSMQALEGPLRRRAELVRAAGSDIALHCNGRMDEMEAVAAGAGTLADAGRRRLAACAALTRRSTEFDVAEAEDACKAACNA